MLYGSSATQDQNFKKEDLTLAHMKIDKVKKKPLPPDLKYEYPYKRKKGKGKVPRSWLDMFKWRPKDRGHDVNHGVNNISLKEAPS